MYISVYGCTKWGYESALPHPDNPRGAAVECDPNAYGADGGFLAALFWLVFFFSVAFVVLNLFIAVITAGIDACES